MSSEQKDLKKQRVGYLNSNKRLMMDITQLAHRLYGMDKATRDKFSQFYDAAWHQINLQKDQIALMPGSRDPERKVVADSRYRQSQKRINTMISQANQPDALSPCGTCNPFGYVDKKNRWCSCPFGQDALQKEREKLGIRVKP